MLLPGYRGGAFGLVRPSQVHVPEGVSMRRFRRIPPLLRFAPGGASGSPHLTFSGSVPAAAFGDCPVAAPFPVSGRSVPEGCVRSGVPASCRIILPPDRVVRDPVLLRFAGIGAAGCSVLGWRPLRRRGRAARCSGRCFRRIVPLPAFIPRRRYAPPRRSRPICRAKPGNRPAARFRRAPPCPSRGGRSRASGRAARGAASRRSSFR